ncbi:peptide chain release factor 3 [Aeromicrobium sp. CTD01-1L150]|uniref:peptide chain release factor 3 n=1 Tax=Aeromicrobium sp. CTD01-1L150 TaxID=3341830 RepID=UPI0035BF3BAC
MDIAREAARRRTFAIISHPDAGKSTLTEALALHTQMIGEAGVTHGKAGRRATVSDWMEMERARGISISSTALQMEFGDHVINVVDTPGHADFSEDTYRVLAAVDVAVMVLDAAKGLEPQTLKLFDVCRRSGIPVVTVVNKWDRPGLDPLELLDQVQQRLGIVPTPVTWPIGIAGDFRGALDRRTGRTLLYERTAGGATMAGERVLTDEEARELIGQDWQTAVEGSELLDADGLVHDQDQFLQGRTTPVLFAASLLNFGVAQLLDVLVDIAPPAGDRPDAAGVRRPVDAPFSAYVFKVQAGMDRAHRDHVAFARVCSGIFERGEVVEHAATGRPFATKYAQSMFGRARTSADVAWPGDIIGLVNASGLRIGDTLRAPGERVEFPAVAKFAPEHFAVIRSVDTGRYKQFRRGIEQLDREGVAQVLRSDARGDQAPVLAAVGPMQFEVVQDRLRQEFRAETRLEPLPYSLAREVAVADVPTLAGRSGVETFERSDGVALALFGDRWVLRSVERAHPELVLGVLAADVEL